jgi:hypothetical protein
MSFIGKKPTTQGWHKVSSSHPCFFRDDAKLHNYTVSYIYPKIHDMAWQNRFHHKLESQKGLDGK